MAEAPGWGLMTQAFPGAVPAPDRMQFKKAVLGVSGLVSKDRGEKVPLSLTLNPAR